MCTLFSLFLEGIWDGARHYSKFKTVAEWVVCAARPPSTSFYVVEQSVVSPQSSSSLVRDARETICRKLNYVCPHPLPFFLPHVNFSVISPHFFRKCSWSCSLVGKRLLKRWFILRKPFHEPIHLSRVVHCPVGALFVLFSWMIWDWCDAMRAWSVRPSHTYIVSGANFMHNCIAL